MRRETLLFVATCDIAGQVRDGMIVSKLFNQIGVIDASGNYILSNGRHFPR